MNRKNSTKVTIRRLQRELSLPKKASFYETIIEPHYMQCATVLFFIIHSDLECLRKMAK